MPATLADQQLLQRAVASLQSGALDDAKRAFAKFLRRHPRHFGALNLFGILLTRQLRFGEAENVLRQAIGVDARSDATFYNYGIVLKALNRPMDALEAFDKSIAINPLVAESWNNRGTVFNDVMRYDDAIRDFQKAISLQPNYAEAFFNMGHSHSALGEQDKALASYDAALKLKPDFAEALVTRGNVLFQLKYLEDAVATYDRYLKIKPEQNFVLGRRLHAKQLMCDWRNFDTECAALISAIQADQYAASPFEVVSMPSSAADQLRCAQIFLKNTVPAPTVPLRRGKRSVHGRIRLAYVSADYRDHAVAHLAAGLFEHSDRARFETFAISLTPSDGSQMRSRLEGAFDHFIDVSHLDDETAARRMHELNADIAINLSGFTSGARPGIMAHRPCPIQVNYLGFPGTMGAEFIDYILADRIVIPVEQQPFYSEKVVYLPDAYQVNDSKRRISERTSTRSEVGLPERGFVFCCFNNTYKITPTVFDVWMRLLRAAEGSILWLLRDNAIAETNLRKEAVARGIDPSRLVFAGRIRYEDHLARHRLADLFLDTLPYNAHTTASDALWAGLPVLTCRGETFAGRVAASLLQVVGLPELVTTSLDDYEVLALRLARDPHFLAEIKAKLARNRDTCALFDTVRSTRYIEAAYATMWENWQRGEAPKSFVVEPNGP